MNQATKSVIYRFARAFVAAGIASVVVFIQAGVVIKSFEDLKQFGVAMIIAFITGGLMALDKAIRGQDYSGTIERLEK